MQDQKQKKECFIKRRTPTCLYGVQFHREALILIFGLNLSIGTPYYKGGMRKEVLEMPKCLFEMLTSYERHSLVARTLGEISGKFLSLPEVPA